MANNDETSVEEKIAVMEAKIRQLKKERRHKWDRKSPYWLLMTNEIEAVQREIEILRQPNKGGETDEAASAE